MHHGKVKAKGLIIMLLLRYTLAMYKVEVKVCQEMLLLRYTLAMHKVQVNVVLDVFGNQERFELKIKNNPVYTRKPIYLKY